MVHSCGAFTPGARLRQGTSSVDQAGTRARPKLKKVVIRKKRGVFSLVNKFDRTYLEYCIEGSGVIRAGFGRIVWRDFHLT